MEVGTVYELLQLAILVHKYDCSEALRMAFWGCLATFSEAEDPPDHEWDYLVAVCNALDQPQYFRLYTEKQVVFKKT